MCCYNNLRITQEGEEFDCLYNFTGLFFNKETGQCDWAAKTVCFSQDVTIYLVQYCETDKYQLSAVQTAGEDIEAVEAEIDYDCEVPGVFPDPDYCMRYIRCNRQLFVRRPKLRKIILL